MSTLLYYTALVFMISLVSNATPFFGAAYTVYASIVLMNLKPNAPVVILFIVVTALGAALAKNTMYLIGVALRRPMARSRNMIFLRGLLRLGFLWLIIIVLAVIPGIPLDDYIYVGTGAAGASLSRLNAYVFLGKLIKSSIEIPIELTLLNTIYNVTSTLGLSRLEFQLIFAIVFTALGVVLYKLDWWSMYNWLRRRISVLPDIN
ncbi:hypothetical protein [Caldivirga maquilingensis]|uniref:SNARE associated Golgi protein n=1 Tax=Caldivirga maquilingensis (strain ATCC 700844 / DSM 13496 / JCM 10307 / IC-167) TaxID=397948 RepID=A8ME52_CALMQ|nr:hypothetical protein [Caldivirga maquilingensis]ABW02058.1 conserved hypothetical protein [Caldivirga maquilingensis IC-167]